MLPVEVGCWLPCGLASKGTSGQHANYNVGLQRTCVVATGRRSHPGIVGGEWGVGWLVSLPKIPNQPLKP